MDRDLRIVASETFDEAGAGALVRVMREAVQARSRCAVALAGGSTPRPVYRRLATVEDLDWPAVHVYFGDERAVPPDDPESNYAMARETLLDHVPIPEGQQHRIEAERDDLGSVAAGYGRRLPDRLDLLVLGIGADGHTASLFPGSPALGETRRRAAVVESPNPPAHRVTITPPVIRSARATVVLAAGRRKARAVRRVLEEKGDLQACPARLARHGTWVLDRAAASQLDTPVEGEASSPPPERDAG